MPHRDDELVVVVVGEEPQDLFHRELTVEEVLRFLSNDHDDELVVAVGHESTASTLSTLLGVEVSASRKQILLGIGDALVVAQLKTGARIPEGKVLGEEEVSTLLFRFVYLEPGADSGISPVLRRKVVMS